MKDKPNVNYQYPKSGGGGCGIGCFAAGCLGIVIVFMLVIFAGYYSMFHSNLPLRFIETAIEESGEVEIDGLDGTLSSGFTADEFRFKTEGDEWSKLSGISFQYENSSSFFGTDKLIVKEVSVDSGVIYADWDPSANQFDFSDLDGDIEDFQAELEGNEEEFNIAMNNSFGSLLIQLNTVSIANLRIINPETKDELTIDDISFVGFKFENGKFVDLGELTIHTSQLDVETVEPKELVDIENARRLEGTIRQALDVRLIADVPFIAEYGIADDLEVSSLTSLFNDQLKVVDTQDEVSVTYDQLQLEQYFQAPDGGIVPTDITLKLTFDENKKNGPNRVSEDGSFRLGATRFSNPKIKELESGWRSVTASAIVNDLPVTIQFNIESPYTSWSKLRLESGSMEAKEVWAQTVYGKSYNDLDPNDTNNVDAMQPKKREPQEIESPPKNVESPPNVDSPPAPPTENNQSASAEAAASGSDQ